MPRSSGGRLLAEIGVGGHGHWNIVNDENQNWWCPTHNQTTSSYNNHIYHSTSFLAKQESSHRLSFIVDIAAGKCVLQNMC